MPSRTTALHHQQKTLKKQDKHPVIDKLIYFAAVFSPAMTLPQIAKIWVEQNASGVSVISWMSYTLVTIIWLSYGIAHKEKVIIFSNVIWIFLNIAIVIGTLLYG